MRIAASLSVKDEAELIEPAIRHLRAIGVDHIIACDMNSTDGSYEILERHRSDQDFWVFRLRDDDTDGFDVTWARANVALARSTRADWVLFLDADEFLIPKTGRLRDCASLAEADVLLVDRLNIPLGPDGPLMPDELSPAHYEELLLLAKPFDDPRTHLELNPTDAWIRAKQDPKVMACPARIGSLEAGAHDIIAGDPDPVRRLRPEDLIVAHLPFTTRARFTRKVDNIRRAFGDDAEFDDENLAWHWQRWLRLANQGRLGEEFDRNVFDARSLAEERSQGVIRSAAELFRDRSQ